jgi:hypothetical protein
MPTVRITIHLPYLLLVPPGEYHTPLVGGSVNLAEVPVSGSDATSEARTDAWALFDVFEGGEAKAQERQRRAEADRLLRRVNHLLRWYRATTGHRTIIELTRAQASPFRFADEGTGMAWGGSAPLEYEAQDLVVPEEGSRAAFGDAIRQGLADKTDPDVATLNLLDAEHALRVGRFREAVLLCWGAIDSNFNRKFKRLVEDRLTDEWPEGCDFLKGIDFGLRHKMTTGLRLVAGRSLFAEPDRFWQHLSTSYGQRNKIIHEGQIAHEDDARLAIDVAGRTVQIMGSLVS